MIPIPGSGTWGSVVGLLLFLFLELFKFSWWVNLAIIIWLLIIGFHICESAGKSFTKADHSAIVWDEIVGMMLVLVFIPDITSSWFKLLLAFLFFRFFDIFKIPPAKQIDNFWHNGFGVMLDDVVAAIYTIISMIIILHIFKFS